MNSEQTKLSDQLINLRGDLVQEYGISIELQNRIGKAHNCALNLESPEGQSSPKIKQLKWIISTEEVNRGWRSDSPLFNYKIKEIKKNGKTMYSSGFEDFHTLDECKADCQKSYESLVLQNLEL